jgi:antitoxin component YwqK of YwqJK toxin-antitoxin module
MLRAFLTLTFIVALALPVRGADWFVSNPVGMAVEASFREAALRGEYALAVERLPYTRAKANIRTVFAIFFTRTELEAGALESRTLYHNRAETEKGWLFYNLRGHKRAIINVDDKGTGFYELYDESGRITEEGDLAASKKTTFNRFRYYNDRITAVTWYETPEKGGERLLYTDSYRYTRSGALRWVERNYAVSAAEISPERVHFSRLSTETREQPVFSPLLMINSEFFEGVLAGAGETIVYTPGEKGRVVNERRENADGELIGEFIYTWSEDRIVKTVWRTETEEWVLEIEYDSNGDRLVERGYKNGVLERTMTAQGDLDVEELYFKGNVILRTYWDGKRKVREERPPREDRPSVGETP